MLTNQAAKAEHSHLGQIWPEAVLQVTNLASFDPTLSVTAS